MKKIMIIFGTRPEVLKLFPIIEEFKKRNIQTCNVFTGQHNELAKDIISTFKIHLDYSLNIMTLNQSLTTLTERLHEALKEVLIKEEPELVIVQGDTTTAFVGALEAFYHKIPVAHVEAGLRSYDIYNPFPEEVNRRLIAQIANINFAPTDTASDNLKKENVPGQIIITGNTSIDTLLSISKDIQVEQRNQVLITLHRRESLGKPLQSILKGIKLFLDQCPEWQIVFPMHPNPLVRQTVHEILGNNKQAILIEPVDYKTMVTLMKESAFILTDSGGIQEEAPSLNKPILVARETTERPEGIRVGAAMLVGTDTKFITQAMIELSKKEDIYQSMINKINPYGEGRSAYRICQILLNIK